MRLSTLHDTTMLVLLLASTTDAFLQNGATSSSSFRRSAAYVSQAAAPVLAPVNGEVPASAVSIVSDSVVEESVGLLNEALVSYNSTAAAAILSELGAMRTNNTDSTVVEAYMNGLLLKGPDKPLPTWARFSPLVRFSKRARLASLRRSLDLTTPPPGLEDENEDDEVSQQRRRRRALFSLLRALAAPAEEEVKGIAIRSIEKKARRGQEGRNSKEDLTQRRPENLETPAYTVLGKSESIGYEVRRYDPFSVCTVEMNKPRPVDAYNTDAVVTDPKMASARAFGALAGYLFGKNEQEQAMKMTTPVLSNERSGQKQMSFILPSEFWTDGGLSTAPKPMEGSGVTLERNEGGVRAVVMFGGYASKAGVSKRKEKLLQALAKDKEWDAVENEPVALAQYNDPFTPPWKRLNEVSIAVRPRK